MAVRDELTVYATKVGVGLLADRSGRGPDDSAPELPAPPPGSAAAELLRRGETAGADITDLVRRHRAGWVGEHLVRVDLDTRDAVASLRRVAGRLALVDAGMARIDVAGLQRQRQDILGQDTSGEPGLHAENERAVAAIDAQLAAHQRLRTARSTLSARLQTAVLGLEGVVTRVHEVLAAADSASRPDTAISAVDDMQGDLDALREGLAEAEAVATGDWGAAHGL